jgi:catechol 2,3-dioxygenase-like lactoylglutathione lyase family enzyme
MSEALSHITFIVHDLDRMEEILTHVFLARKIYDSGTDSFSVSPERFFDIGGVWVATMLGDPLAARTYNHVAFQMRPDEYEDRLARIKSLGLDVREGRSRIDGEGSSIYFYDDDNHMFELHSGTLEERLETYLARGDG